MNTNFFNPSAQLRAGAGKVKLGYPEGFFPYKGFNGRYLTGAHDDLYVRCVLLDAGDKNTALFISIDAGDLSDEWLGEISSASGVPEDNIFLTATHTHEAPYISRTLPEDVVDKEKTEIFRQMSRASLMEAIGQAKKSLRPARVGFGTGACWVNVYRNLRYTGNQENITVDYITGANPHGPSDKTVAVLKIEDLSGKPIAIVTNYAVHSVVMFFSKTYADGMLVSGDLAGAAMRYVEERADDCVALFTLGAAGDQNPRYVSARNVYDSEGNMSFKDAGEAGYLLLDVQAEELGQEILRVAADISCSEENVDIRASVITISVEGKAKRKGGPMSLPRDYKYEKEGELPLRLSLICLNGIAFMGVSAELVCRLGMDIKTVLTDLGCREAVVITQCNGSISYISDDAGYAEKKFDGLASCVMPGVGRHILGNTADMIKSLNISERR